MGESLALALERAERAAVVAGLTLSAENPLRLDLPPDVVDDSQLDSHAASVIGALYLLSELEQVEVVGCAELISSERASLEIRDVAAAHALEQYAASQPGRPTRPTRIQLYARLFGAGEVDPNSTSPALRSPPNDVFEPLLTAYCDAIGAADDPRPLSARRLRSAGDRLRANLGPRQYGNTLLIAAPLIDQLRASLDLLALAGVRSIFSARGVWDVVRSLLPNDGADIGRHVDRGNAGRVVVGSCAIDIRPAQIGDELRAAAETWLAATGFALESEGAPRP